MLWREQAPCLWVTALAVVQLSSVYLLWGRKQENFRLWLSLSGLWTFSSLGNVMEGAGSLFVGYSIGSSATYSCINVSNLDPIIFQVFPQGFLTSYEHKPFQYKNLFG
uniref:Uncharacterized protein n=1 Tax=Nelumbo nucifera TaxID=4432 RepID=A0A822YP89_NELNU|nr:TPA_asm: hypothetical protein HUJ06_006644 [Nelumbo nucifera]